MQPWPLALLLACSVLPLSSASLAEAATGGAVAYQFDAGTFHDSPDSCEQASATWQVALGAETQAMVVPGDDERDHVTFMVAASDVGTRITVNVVDAKVEVDLSSEVYVPDCTSVFDAA